VAPRRSRRGRASVIAGAAGAEDEAGASANGHLLYYAMSPASDTALRYAGDTQPVALHELADGGGGGGGARRPTVLLKTSGAFRTPQWLPRPQRRASTPAPLAATTAETDGELVLLRCSRAGGSRRRRHARPGRAAHGARGAVTRR